MGISQRDARCVCRPRPRSQNKGLIAHPVSFAAALRPVGVTGTQPGPHLFTTAAVKTDFDFRIGCEMSGTDPLEDMFRHVALQPGSPPGPQGGDQARFGGACYGKAGEDDELSIEFATQETVLGSGSIFFISI